ncbi:MAG: type II toxin-antitoxin system RelE/ParE family toxin [Microcystaceae cyanobacterium]
MKITFKNKKLKKLCENQDLALKQLGKPCTRKLKSRLADLNAAKSVKDLVAGRPHPLKGDGEGLFALDLAGGKRLVFEPSDDPPPLKEDLSINWAKVTAIRIVFIGDYHD